MRLHYCVQMLTINRELTDTRLLVTSGLTLVLTAIIILSIPAVGGVAAQSDNTTTTPAQTEEAACEDPSGTGLSQSRLYAPVQEIDTQQAGQVAGGFQVAADSSCSVVVSITMSVPSGMSISGSSDIVASGAGLATAEFTVQPGEIRDIRAEVYSQNTGQRSVTADITYWPEGNQDMSREIDGIQLTYNVQSANTPSEEANNAQSTDISSENTNSPDGENDSGLAVSPTLLIAGAFVIVVLALVAMSTRS
jgi:hypothetical protein